MSQSASFNRRYFLKAAALASAIAGAGCHSLEYGTRGGKKPPARFFFTTQGKTAMMNADGTGLRYFEFDVPGQATWQPCGFFPDGRRVLFLSMEPRRDGPGKPFDEYYHTTPTHIWIHDLDSDSLEEIATRDRMAVFYTPQLLLQDGRMLVQVIHDKVAQTFSMNLDGTDAREFTRAGEGMPYGLSLSPDGRRVAYHIASPEGYQIWTSDIEGKNRTRIAAHPDHLYFCPVWSPDGGWLAFQDCLYKEDPGHDWSDLVISRPDGSEQRLLTTGQALWFAATYGPPDNRGGGSNTPSWSCAGAVLCSKRLPDSKVPWEYQADRPDTDHFNRDYKPEKARGGAEIHRIDLNGSSTPLTHSDRPVWDFRQAESPDGKRILFCRAATGEAPAIWIMNADGGNARPLTKGLADKGADHPRWMPAG